MEVKKSSGCWIAAWAAVAVAVLASLGIIYGIVSLARSGDSGTTDTSSSKPLAGAVEIDFSAPLGAPLVAGEAVGREIFLRFQQDGRITRLAKDSFNQAAQGAQVTWDLQVGELTSRDGSVAGELHLPYTAKVADSVTTSGRLSIRAEFTADQTPALLTLRRDDWVRVGGTLDLSNGQTTIREAKVVQEP